MSATVLTFTTTCPACKEALHDRCWQFLGELLGHEHVPCKCDCRDKYGELTQAALVDMMRRHPDVVARRVRLDASIERGSLALHMRVRPARLSAP